MSCKINIQYLRYRNSFATATVPIFHLSLLLTPNSLEIWIRPSRKAKQPERTCVCVCLVAGVCTTSPVEGATLAHCSAPFWATPSTGSMHLILQDDQQPVRAKVAGGYYFHNSIQCTMWSSCGFACLHITSLAQWVSLHLRNTEWPAG